MTADIHAGHRSESETTFRVAAADHWCADHVYAPVCVCLQGVLLQAVRGYASKDVRFGIECREAVLAGVNKLADAVQVTLGPKVRQTQHTRHGVSQSVSRAISTCAAARASTVAPLTVWAAAQSAGYPSHHPTLPVQTAETLDQQ
jgi:hypothetical protein